MRQARIEQFCRERSLPLHGLRFEIGRSDERLPGLAATDLDLVLIDGAHGFPMPFLDWYYTAERLKVGGLLIIDDTQLWTGHTLKCYLQHEPEWRLEVDYAPRSVVFRKILSNVSGKHERQQPYVMQETVKLLFEHYPTFVDDMRPYIPPELFAAWERGWRYRSWQARQLLGRVLPKPITPSIKTILGLLRPPRVT